MVGDIYVRISVDRFMKISGRNHVKSRLLKNRGRLSWVGHDGCLFPDFSVAKLRGSLLAINLAVGVFIRGTVRKPLRDGGEVCGA